MSVLRLFGMAIGGGLLIFVLRYYRRERWSRGAFVLGSVTGTSIFTVSADPASVDFLRDLFSLETAEYGRLLFLLICSNLAALLLIVYAKAKIDRLKDLVDRSLRFAAVEAVAPADQLPERVKPIMVVIPALNEAENLNALLPRMPKEVCGRELGVLVVDDGSTDDTKNVALHYGALVARTVVNRGQGAASRVGYSFLARQKVSIGVTMDGDNQHDPNEISLLVEPIVAGKLDLVIGSRVLGSADRTSATRRLGISLFSRLLSIVIDHRITDSTSGFKAFRIDKMAGLDLREDQFQSSEVLIAAAKRGLRIGEVPIHISQRSYGLSRKGRDIVYATLWLRTLAKAWWR